MMAKPMKTLELHYPMIQFLIISDILVMSFNVWVIYQTLLSIQCCHFSHPGEFKRDFRKANISKLAQISFKLSRMRKMITLNVQEYLFGK